MSNHAYKNSEKIQIILIDKLIINPQFIGSRQTYRIVQISKNIEEKMVLRIKEREEAIQLLAMDPQVCGKLLTLHRRGNGVDVEALHGRIPLRRDAAKGRQMGSHGYRRLWRWKSVFVAFLIGFGIFENIQAEEIGRRRHGGATRVGARSTPLCTAFALVADSWLL